MLADVFNRLGYMERKGSGFGKILNGYKAQINYTEDKRPTFRSDRYQFTVVMPNLNYSVPQGVSQDVTQDVSQDVAQEIWMQKSSRSSSGTIKSAPKKWA